MTSQFSSECPLTHFLTSSNENLVDYTGPLKYKLNKKAQEFEVTIPLSFTQGEEFEFYLGASNYKTTKGFSPKIKVITTNMCVSKLA